MLFREQRPRPPEELSARAEKNLADIRRLLPTVSVEDVEIFSADLNTVVGGRTAARALDAYDLSRFTDIIVDFSAISIGVSFPITKLLFEKGEKLSGVPALHLMVAASPAYDDTITPLAGDVPTSIHGFMGRSGVFGQQPGKLWLPQLKFGQEATLSRLGENIDPDDTCPILPFPASNPRLGDDLLEAYSANLNDWEVDPRNVIYASESDPLDIYRTIVRLNREREEVFSSEGSLVILSPVGSKVVAIGSLMAALECDLAIRYLEAESYSVKAGPAAVAVESEIIHVWLTGGPAWEMR
jgi:hypothetical protein